MASGGDEAFIVTPEYADKYGLEDELLWPIIRGKNVRRWAVKWDRELVIYPYNENGSLVDLDQYPNIRAHLEDHMAELQDRYCVKKGGKSIYEYHGPHPKSMFEGNFKIATPDMATENHFSYTNCFDCFKNTVYVLTFEDTIPYSEEELLGLLNSSVAEFAIKQTSPPLRGKPFRYRYKSQYVNDIPLSEDTAEIESVVKQILELEEIQAKIDSFPKNYVEDSSTEVDYIDYEWQTRRYPVDAEIQARADGTFAIEAGRSDSITGPRILSEERARYVHAAVDGRNVKSGEETTIPIPRRDADVAALLDELREDRRTVEETDIEALEAEIDEVVYDLFDLTEDERQVIEEYLEVF